MASYHINISTGAKGAALEHAQYIGREGRFSEERYGELEARGQGNMPAWAREDTSKFWRASDEFERANGNTYREYELALPRELSPAARVALVERFAEQELGTSRPYQWAIHNGRASDGKEQPHVHLMFSDRQQDGIERGPEQFFKRFNAQHPERGGAQKFSYGATKEEAALAYEGIRERWAEVQNQALEHAGVEARVDHRSLKEQGIEREPEVHRGPAVSGIEARGEVSEVGERQREQRQAREAQRELVAAEVKEVTRAELAAERVAVRERREMALEAKGEERELILPRVEADRREQLGRAQALAERRIERRQGIGGRLLEEARALRARLVQELTRVKEWVHERFRETVHELKERAQDLFGERKTPKKEAGLDLTAEKARGRAAGQEWRQALHQKQAEEQRLVREREAEKRAELKREQTVQEFRSLAARREAKALGYGDKGEQWRATPEKLREQVERFNALEPKARGRALESLAQQPQRVRALEQWFAVRRERVRELDRGLDLGM